ncbi:MAG: hypothetical protein AB8F34_08885 [Akkermansiaceae bacterium]
MQRFSRLRFLASTLLGLVLGLQVSAQEKVTQPHWPSSFKPNSKAKIVLISEGGGDKNYIYHTRNFELHSRAPLSRRHLQKFATVAESVPQVLAKFPLPLLGMPEGERAKVLIYPDEDTFIKAGGTPGSGGYYSGRKSAILLRADTFLQPPPPTGSKLPPRADYDLLVHEFVHLCMHKRLAYLPVWFTEGVAEYIAAAHQDNGFYRFDQMETAIRKRARHNLPNDKDFIRLPGIAKTMALTHQTWSEELEHGETGDGYRMYGTSTLIVHTLFNGGEKRRQLTREFLQNAKPRSPIKMEQRVEKLIPLAEREKLQQRIATYWRPRGLRIKFEAASE